MPKRVWRRLMTTPPTASNQAWPELMTVGEAIKYLRLDKVNIKKPEDTLFRYRKRGLLRGTQVSKVVLYRKSELDAFLARQTEENPR